MTWLPTANNRYLVCTRCRRESFDCECDRKTIDFLHHEIEANDPEHRVKNRPKNRPALDTTD